MLNQLKEFFYFNRTERRGTVILMLLLFIQLALLVYHNQFEPYTSSVPNSKEFTHLILQLELKSKKRQRKEDSLRQLALENRQKKALNKVADSRHGAKDRYSLVSGIKNYPSKSAENKNQYKEYRVEMNTASQEDWMKLRGIGPVYSSRIIKYRDLLGGFTIPIQMVEVYGISDSLFQSLEDHLEIKMPVYHKMNINTFNVFQLSRHPYITWHLSEIIVKYREENGVYSNVDELRDSGLLNDELYSKIAPYLTTEE